MLDCSLSVACMLLELHHPHLHDQGHQRVLQLRRGLLSALPVWLLLSPPSLNVDLLPIAEKCQFPVNMGYQLCLAFPTWGRGSLQEIPSQHHQWTEMGLLIYSKSHNQNAQRELGKNRRPGYCLSHKVLSCTVHKSAIFFPAHVSWMKCFWGYLWKEWSWGRKETVGFMALRSYYWFWPSLWLPLDKEYANSWGSKFYTWYLFVSSLCLGM